MNGAESDCTRWEMGDVCVDAGARKATRHGREIPLPRLSWDLLLVLLRDAPNAVSTERLMDEVWPGLVVNPETVTKRVNLLRHALGDDPRHPHYIEGVRGYGYRVAAPVAALPGGAEPSAPGRRWRLPAVAGTLAFGLAVLLYHAVDRSSESQGAAARDARIELLPKAQQLLYERDFTGAWRLARQVQRQLPDDPQARRILASASVLLTLHTVPAGAEVWFRDYLDVDGEWEPLGVTPLVDVPVPDEYLRWRIRKDGFEALELAWGDHLDGFEFELLRQGNGEPDMVRIPAGRYQLGRAQPVALEQYWIDEFEVTNERFQRFVDAGGYRDPTHWEGLFPAGEGTGGFDDSVSTFVDMTGRPGPAGWRLGRYQEGEGEGEGALPVTGVSWFEAAAFCRFAGKRLPTLYHWQVAAGRTHADKFSEIVQLSNFSGEGPAPAGRFHGLGPFGGYDMAGNAKEWVWNAVGEMRYILGGGWNEAPHMFVDPDARPPAERRPTFGFRCAKFSDAVDEELLAAIARPDHDFSDAQVVGDDVFAIYRNLYVYDRKDLAVKLESEDEAGDWRRQTVSFDAGFGDERVLLRLFLPERTRPPYQAVLYFPGATSLRIESSEVTREQAMMDFVPRSGRALAIPVFKGMYERRMDEFFGRPIARRDLVIQWAREIGRTIDYLETRPDIDTSRLAFSGLSLGAEYGPIFLAVEERFRTAVLLGGGFDPAHMPNEPPEINPWHFAPRVSMPVVMINGHHDFLFPLETSQRPMFNLLGTSPEHKRHVVVPGGHIPPWNDVIRETLDWLDRYLGPVPAGTTN